MSNKQFYVYVIYVDGVVRYIGKGTNGRMHFHVIEARRINSRRARGANTDRTSTKFYRKLAEAMRHGAIITEKIMIDGLTNQRAYRIEKQKIEELHKQKRDQLWNTIDERLIGVTWEEFKRKRREESFDDGRLIAPSVGGPGRKLHDLRGLLSELRAMNERLRKGMTESEREAGRLDRPVSASVSRPQKKERSAPSLRRYQFFDKGAITGELAGCIRPKLG